MCHVSRTILGFSTLDSRFCDHEFNSADENKDGKVRRPGDSDARVVSKHGDEAIPCAMSPYLHTCTS